MSRRLTTAALATAGVALTFYFVNRAAEYLRGAIDRGDAPDSIAPDFFRSLPARPFHISTDSLDLLAGGVAVVLLLLVIAYQFAAKVNTRHGEEHGSARWAGPSDQRKLKEKNPENRLQLTATEALSLDTSKHHRNLNVLVIGGSGSGKSRRYVIPNVLSMTRASFGITDPKGEIRRMLEQPLRDAGFDVRVLNLVDLRKSNGFNPFRYFDPEAPETSVLQLAENIVSNTTGTNDSGDKFFDRAEKALLIALIAYVWATTPDDGDQEASLVDVADLQRRMRAFEGKKADEATEVDIEVAAARQLLDVWDGGPVPEGMDPADADPIPDETVRNVLAFACRQYGIYEQGAGETKKSILISLGVRLAPFDVNDVRAIVQHDDLALDQVGDRPTAVFLELPDTHGSFNFLGALFWKSFFEKNIYLADHSDTGRLGRHVHCFLDEFANIGKVPEFEKIIATIRGRNMGASVIVQADSQGKAIYKDHWATIKGNCDTTLYLGAPDIETHKVISASLGTETVVTQNTTRNYGGQSGGSRSNNAGKRDLMTPDEVGQLDVSKAILLIRSMRPFHSDKAPMVDVAKVVKRRERAAAAEGRREAKRERRANREARVEAKRQRATEKHGGKYRRAADEESDTAAEGADDRD